MSVDGNTHTQAVIIIICTYLVGSEIMRFGNPVTRIPLKSPRMHLMCIFMNMCICVCIYRVQKLRHDIHCNILQLTISLQRTAMHCNALQRTDARVYVGCGPCAAECTATYCNAGYDCNTLQHTATHCNTLQHTATQRYACIHRVRILRRGIPCNTLQQTLTLQHTATHICTCIHRLQILRCAIPCNKVQYIISLQHTATHICTCIIGCESDAQHSRQYTATHYFTSNTLQHIYAHIYSQQIRCVVFPAKHYNT